MILDKLKEPFVIGVAGDSGSGKTTFAESVRKIFAGNVATITLDDYHKYGRKERKRLGITPLNPEMTDLNLFREHLKMIKEWKEFEKPIYDHEKGEVRCCERFKPEKIVIAEGLHVLYDGIREFLDYKIFVDPARIVKRKWKIKRDMEKRGYKREEVIEEIIQRESDYKRFVDFQKIYADVVIKIYPSSLESSERISTLLGMEEMYRVRLIFTNISFELDHVTLNVDLSRLIKASERDFAISFFSDYYYGKRASFIDIDGFLNVEIFESLLDALREETGYNVKWEAQDYVNSIDVARLLLCWNLVEIIKMKE